MPGKVNSTTAKTDVKFKPGEIIDLEEIIVKGKLHKPEVFYVLGRSELTYKPPIKCDNFVNKIFKSIEDNPF